MGLELIGCSTLTDGIYLPFEQDLEAKGLCRITTLARFRQLSQNQILHYLRRTADSVLERSYENIYDPVTQRLNALSREELKQIAYGGAALEELRSCLEVGVKCDYIDFRCAVMPLSNIKRKTSEEYMTYLDQLEYAPPQGVLQHFRIRLRNSSLPSYECLKMIVDEEVYTSKSIEVFSGFYPRIGEQLMVICATVDHQGLDNVWDGSHLLFQKDTLAPLVKMGLARQTTKVVEEQPKREYLH